MHDDFPANLSNWLWSWPLQWQSFPTFLDEEFPGNLVAPSGLVVLAGVAVCLVGIAVCGYAGIRKERELTEEQTKASIKEFSLVKGFAVAVFAGVMSACMALGIDAGKPIADAAFQEVGKVELLIGRELPIHRVGRNDQQAPAARGLPQFL